MAEKFKLQVVTPDKEFYDDYVEAAYFKTSEGDIGVLYDHIAVTTGVASGMLTIKNDGDERIAVIHSGFAEITPEHVTILTDAAEWMHEIDVSRAKEARIRAERRIKAEDPEINIVRAKAALTRALVRIDVSEYHSSLDE